MARFRRRVASVQSKRQASRPDVRPPTRHRVAPRRRLIGNEMISGDRRAKMYRMPTRAVFNNAQELQVQRQRLIDLAAEPPHILPKPIRPPSRLFDQVAYSVFTIAVLAAIAVLTPYINWAFLAYGLAVVIMRIDSRAVFGSSLICLAIIPVTTALQRGTLANVFAVMTFYFLLVGLIRATLELRRDRLKEAKK